MDPSFDDDIFDESITILLETVATQHESANAFSEWAQEQGYGPADMLAIFMTLYVHLRTFLPESSLTIFMMAITSFAEHAMREHPGTFYTNVDGEQVPLPVVNEGDAFGAGQEMLRTLAAFKRGDTDGAS